MSASTAIHSDAVPVRVSARADRQQTRDSGDDQIELQRPHPGQRRERRAQIVLLRRAVQLLDPVGDHTHVLGHRRTVPPVNTRRNRPLALLMLAVAIMTACGGSSDGGRKRTSTPTTASSADSGVAPTGAATTLAETLPVADPAGYVGRNRVVHLAVRPDGTTPALDIWALRSFEFAPILLVEGIEYGEISDEYGAPDGMSVAAVESGAGPDATQFAGVFSAGDDQQYLHLILFDRDAGTAAGVLLENVDPGNPNAFPEATPGQALVQFYAYQLRLNSLSTGEGFEQRIAGLDPSFNVGIEGTPGCAPQPRLTDQGFSPAVLGGTQRPAFDLAPGTTSFTFHGWGTNNQDCADPSLIDALPITVAAGDRAWVLLHSRDGKTIESLVVPVG